MAELYFVVAQRNRARFRKIQAESQQHRLKLAILKSVKSSIEWNSISNVLMESSFSIAASNLEELR